MLRYITIKEDSEAMQVIEKSRFIAHIKRVNSREEADAFLAEIRSQYRDASHNVPAFVIGEKQELQWASDDGEPSGTSGAPILQMLVKEGLTNIAMVVTRYFGGIKLGTGGLVRAYTSTARLALQEAGRFEVKDICQKNIKFSYNLLAKVQSNAVQYAYVIKDSLFEDEVTMTIECEPEQEESIVKMLLELSAGRVKIL